MIELVPIMLFLLGVSPEHPGEAVMKRVPVIYASEAECAEAGKEMVERHEMYREFFANAEFTYQCMPVPKSEEYDELFQRDAEAQGQ